jgi:hypothetical protein
MTAVVLSAPFAPRGPAYAGRSTTSAVITDAGLVLLTVQVGLAYTQGLRVRVTSTVSGAWMEGIVDSYEDTALTIFMNLAAGAGLYSDWNINLAGEPTIIPSYAGAVSNASLIESHLSNAATFAIKTLSGNDPSTVDVVRVLFPDANSRLIANALSLVLPAGVGLGAVNATSFRVWFVLIDDAGTPKVGAFQSRSSLNVISLPANGILPLSILGSGAGQVYFTSPPASSRAYVIVGYADYESGLSTAGNWNVSPTRIILYGPGIRLPGQELQSLLTATGANASGSALIPLDDTIPQISEGTQFMSCAITPQNAISMLEVSCRAVITMADTNRTVTGALFLLGQNNAIAVSWGAFGSIGLAVRQFNNSLAARTYTFRAGKDLTGAGSMGFNGNPGLPFWGGTANSFIRVRELQL